MEYRLLGHSSLRASVLGIGALHFGNFCDRKTAVHLIHRGMDEGINFVDTAPMYGDGFSEDIVGDAIQGRREAFIVTTKIGLKPHDRSDGSFGVGTIELNEHNIRSGLELSLKALRTDYIDLYQLHAFDHVVPVQQTVEVMEKLVSEGKIRYFGCANYDAEELMTTWSACGKVGRDHFVSFQCHYNMIERRLECDLLPSCRKLQVGIICNRALARGILSGQYRRRKPYPAGSRAQKSWRIRRLLSDSVLGLVGTFQEFSAQRGYDVGQLAIAWLCTQPDVSIVLAGMHNLQHLNRCMKATDWKLSQEELKAIDEIVKKHGLADQICAMPETFFEK